MQFTIRDLLWLTLFVVFGVLSIKHQLTIDRFDERLEEVDRRAWNAIGNDRTLMWMDDKIHRRIDDIEVDSVVGIAEWQQLQNIVLDHEKRIGR